MDFSKVKNLAIPEGNVTSISIGGKVVWKKEEKPVRPNAFRFKNVSGLPNTLKLNKHGNAPQITLEKSSDGVNYVPCDIYAGILLQPDETVYLRGINNGFCGKYVNDYNNFQSDGDIECHGSAMDLLDGATDTLELKHDHPFRLLFDNATHLLTAPQLPATTLASDCYSQMFYGCTSLTTAPQILPATTLAQYCYRQMFYGCTSLTTAPQLPATRLAQGCYSGMFNGCTSLTTAPQILPATTLADICYYEMFRDCTSLIQAPELPATKLAERCYQNMFQGCTSLTTAPELPATTLTWNCYNRMFYDCSKLNYVKIGATTWNNSNAGSWLSGTAATGTIEIPAELVTWDGTGTQPAGSIPLNSVDGVPTGWTAKKPVARPNAFRFKNVSSLPNTLKLTKKTSTAPTVALEKSSNGVDFVPFDCYSGIELQPGETVYLRGSNKTFATSVQNRNKFSSNNDIECYGSIMDLCDNGTDTIICTESYQFYGLFEDMSYLLTTPELPAITLTPHCYHALFFRCTSLASIPETLLPATTLIDDCYQTMFGQCTGLKTIPEKLLQSTELANNCYCGMFDGCTALTNSPQLPATTLAGSCYLGMFSGCTALVTAPELPATTLAYRSYESMFSKCHKINYIKIGATSWSRQVEGSIYYNASKWLEKAAAVGTIEMPAELQIGNGEGQIPENSVNGVPTGWTAKKPVVVNSFYIEDASGQPNTLSLTQTGAAPVKLEYSNDGSVWQEWVNCQTTTLPVAANSRIYLRGTNSVFGIDYSNYNKFRCTEEFNVGGDLTTLLVPEGNVLDLTGKNYAFAHLFNGSEAVDASKLQLPSTILAPNCYDNMFNSCYSLTTAPKLPATTLADYCYYYMFSGCKSLTKAPKLPATTLAESCYEWMFYGCKSLTTAPEILPAMTLVDGCYSGMFRFCTSLTTAPALPATTLANSCYSYMFDNCTSLTTAPELPATTFTYSCYEKMFSDCRELNYVKIGANVWNSDYTTDWLANTSAIGNIDAQNLTWDDFYVYSVSGIPEGWTLNNQSKPIEGPRFKIKNIGQSQNTIKLKKSGNAPDIILEKSNDGVIFEPYDCYSGVTLAPKEEIYLRGKNEKFANDTDNFNYFSSTDLFICSGSIMDLCDAGTDTVELKYPYQFSRLFRRSKIYKTPKLPATTLTEGCYWRMFEICRELQVSPELPATTLAKQCYESMFSECEKLKNGPEIFATERAWLWGRFMFNYCKNLKYIKVHMVKWDTGDTDSWMEGVQSWNSGIFVKPAALQIGTGTGQIPENNVSGIPKGFMAKDF